MDALGLFPRLKLFEVSIVLRFCSTKDKLMNLALVNKKWHEVISSKNYAWSVLPLFEEELRWAYTRNVLALVDQISDFGKVVSIPSLTDELLYTLSSSILSSARSINHIHFSSK